MGYYYSEVVNIPDSAFNNYNRSKNYFERLMDSSRIGKNLLNMGTIQKDKNDFFGSKETLTESLNYLSTKKDYTYIVQCYNLLATNHRKLLNFDDALKYYAKAIRMTDSPTDKLIFLNNLAATYIDNQQFELAVDILDSISSAKMSISSQKEYARVLDNLAYAKWLSGDKIKESEFQKPLQIRIQNNDKRGQIASYTHLGEFYSENNPRKATSYFDSVIQLSKILNVPRAEKDALMFLMKLDSKNIKVRNRYVLLQDSLYQQELKVKTQFAKYKYDDKVTQEENLRLEKENAEKELEANNQRTQKIIYLGGFIFTISVLGLSLFGFKQRNKRLKEESKAEKLAAIHDTEAELSRKLHDDHGGKLNQLMSLIQRDADKDLILDKTEELYNHTRDFSRTLNSVDTGPDFWNILKATLEFAKPAEVEMMFNGGKELNWSTVSNQSKTILFKVLQELVINMARHSKAQQTIIIFKDQNKTLHVYYVDDGVGASKEALYRKNGLQNTEKRIHAIGGSIIFDSEDGKGFRAEIRIPN
ncbi:tetratricopeptide repeat-containing sensor histidine kinase [Maribacter sp. 4U21]|uniref:tetratricopeptide repeat-containing sensor histidine kinase n=1 Tax=Maribacter sp. 4U21 TaxID=1889779 RepID=UPI0015D519C6|nr:tetratricopeptide repeat protein [Maribacter sp. 4U21]